jgi:regulatory protein
MAEDDEQAAGPPGDPEQVARIVCLRLLDRRAYTRAELATALRKRGVPDDAGERVLDRFAELGLIDDAAFAAGFAAAQHEHRSLAGRAVAAKLRQRGVADETVLDAIAGIDRDSEAAAARALVERKLRSMSGLAPPVQTRRLVGMLARKGYSAGLAHEIVRSVLREVGNADIAELLT